MGRSPNLKRVHIVVDKREYPSWHQVADEHYHGRVSQAIRDAMNDLIARFKNEGGLLELRPVIERQDAIVELLERAMDTIDHIAGQVEALRTVSRVNIKVLLDAIFKVLEEAHRPLSTEEVSEKLAGHTIQQVRKGLEILFDRFVIEQTKEEGRTMWKLAGCEGDE